MRQAHLGDGVGDVLWLFSVERAGQSGLDVAERASARASVAHDHHGRVLLRPALADIRAGRFFAHRVKVFGADDRAGFCKTLRCRRLHRESSPACEQPGCRAEIVSRGAAGPLWWCRSGSPCGPCSSARSPFKGVARLKQGANGQLEKALYRLDDFVEWAMNDGAIKRLAKGCMDRFPRVD